MHILRADAFHAGNQPLLVSLDLAEVALVPSLPGLLRAGRRPRPNTTDSTFQLLLRDQFRSHCEQVKSMRGEMKNPWLVCVSQSFFTGMKTFTNGHPPAVLLRDSFQRVGLGGGEGE